MCPNEKPSSSIFYKFKFATSQHMRILITAIIILQSVNTWFLFIDKIGNSTYLVLFFIHVLFVLFYLYISFNVHNDISGYISSTALFIFQILIQTSLSAVLTPDEEAKQIIELFGFIISRQTFELSIYLILLGYIFTFIYLFNVERTENEFVVKTALFFSAFFAIVILLIILIFLLNDALPFFDDYGLDKFLIGIEWLPESFVNQQFGARPQIVGTFLVTLGAMVIAVPLGIGTAIFISEIAPSNVRVKIKPIVELLAGIPSVIYGFFGLTVLIPFLQRDYLIDIFIPSIGLGMQIPGLGLNSGNTWLAASILLAVMALPTITSVAEDAINAVPRHYREASLSMGANKWQTISRVTVPSALSGITSAVILGMGRAIGETMAVLMVSGNKFLIPDPIYDIFSGISTVTGTIGIEMAETGAGSLHQHALFALALVLMTLTLIINLFSIVILGRFNDQMSGKSLASEKNKQFFGLTQGQNKLTKGSLLTILSFILAIFYFGLLCSIIIITFAVMTYFITKESRKSITIGILATLLVIVLMEEEVIGINGSIIFDNIMLPTILVFTVLIAYFIKRFIFSKLSGRNQQKVAFYIIYSSIGIVFFTLITLITYIVIRGLPALLNISQDLTEPIMNNWFIVVVFVIIIIILYFINENLGKKSLQIQLNLSKSNRRTIFAFIALVVVFIALFLINWEFLLAKPRGGGSQGGIYYAIIGTFYLIIGALTFALPIGILAAIFLQEYQKESIITKLARSGFDLLNGTPSIVYGLFAYVFFVQYLQIGLSLMAGQLALGLMILPTILRTTEESLKSVPDTIRHGSLALGATEWQTIRKVTLPSALPGVITGAILSIGRAAGETAPIMFVAVVSTIRDLPDSLFDKVMALPYQIYYLSTEGSYSETALSYAFGNALVLMVIVMSLYGVAIYLRNYFQNKVKW